MHQIPPSLMDTHSIMHNLASPVVYMPCGAQQAVQVHTMLLRSSFNTRHKVYTKFVKPFRHVEPLLMGLDEDC